MNIKKANSTTKMLRIGLSGASGTGKTMSALMLAYGLTEDWSKIVVIDTENGSSNLYSHLGPFNVLVLESPYTPQNYINAIKSCEQAGMEVIIVDSITHEWKGLGGCLDMHKKLGGRFQDWGKVTPKHQEFIEAIQKSTSHVITTVRRRQEYLVETNEKGRLEVRKLGTKEETRNGFEYEVTLNFELINQKNLARVTKDRTGVFINKPPFIINEATGKRLSSWLTQNDYVNKMNLKTS